MNKKEIKRIKRHIRIRKKIIGSQERPRLCIHKSAKFLQAQLIDDLEGCTILTVTTNNKDMRHKLKSRKNIAAAKVLGECLAEQAKAKNIVKVVFDRAGYLYHGRVKEFAEAARKAGLVF